MKMAKQVLCDMDKMHHAGCNAGQMSINVPEVTLATLSGRAELSDLIAQFPHLRKNLTFEITEDVFIARAGDMIQRSIASFRAEGIRVSLDDFGTGFASFQHLRILEFDELKLDTAFIGGLGVDPAAEVLVKGFLAIGKGLGVQIIAEGVETQNQVDLLSQMGCEVVQGHVFGAAMTATETIEMLQNDAICTLGSTTDAA
jgi:EAL domain-containing protein (putative c-di-GMP-specific phosphodiesterase class I)